jgi:broad specificity phosphatase PhoE
MNRTTTIHFVRHGKVHNPQELYYGRLPGFHLSSEGLLHVKRAADYLGKYEIAAVYSSPLERATETAKIISEQLGIESQTSELLLEAFSPFDGQSISVLTKRNWDVYTGTEPPYEQPVDILTRAKTFTWQIRSKFPGKNIIAVTHGDLIAFMVLWAKQLSVTPQEKQKLYESFLTYASISSFIYETNVETEIPKFEYFQP